MNRPQFGLDDTSSDQVSLYAILQIMWRRWFVIAICAGSAIVCAVIYLQIATYTYTAELKLSPVKQSLNIGSELSGLASIAGIALPKGLGQSSFGLYLETIRSRSVADALAKRQDLMKVLYKKEWNEDTQTWQENTNLFTPAIRLAKTLLGIRNYPYTPPDGARLQVYLNDYVRASENNRTTVVTVSYNNENSSFAVAFLDALHKEVDNELREKVLTRTNEYIKYLSRQLLTVTIAEYRETLIQVLTEQEKTRMMASSDAPYAADVVGIPSASFRPTFPLPIPVLLGALVIGIFMGILIVLFSPSASRGLTSSPAKFSQIAAREGVARFSE
jgi:uncharacterized protein involved in exopolysaccharide biosynthesis